MKAIGILTSGGDAPGMNAAIRAVVRTAIYYGYKVYGIEKGYRGLLDEEFVEMDLSSVGDIIQRGGTILKSSRCDEFKTAEGREKAVEILENYGIESLVVIGGDGSFTGAKLLSELGVKTIGIPGTIDNDLAYTDYTIGFDTAMNTVIDAIGKIRDTSSSHDRVNIVEVMGRNCGDLALYAGVAGGAETIVVPEREIRTDEIVSKLRTTQKRGKKHSIIVLAEGADIEGGALGLKNALTVKDKADVRITVLGHVQRGGSPSAFDRILASKLGNKAVELLIEGKSKRVVGIKDNKIIDLDIDDALSMEKEFDQDLYEMAKILSI
ncbi:6-phosphofructokinase [Peptostreptococcus russellii]|uniref:ATP-dependent 6-phosphofructokinase n=1 Tax=Peptostreptococcus russellii TaxID=215200 RepID=A0A1H8GN04_9FIRM|nr:6-phosphofructokinase [Peptostreptococcus russellii]MBC2578079.1 6-phosphofructokinase [Peptostreptococcus russellii]SEN45363.1 6-phosphofructokinase [Peptostreptococcus russellii]